MGGAEPPHPRNPPLATPLIANCEQCYSEMMTVDKYMRDKIDSPESVLLISSERELSQDLKLVELVKELLRVLNT